jgi:hypothetical protein
VCPGTAFGPLSCHPHPVILTPAGSNRASGLFHSSCELIYPHSLVHVDLLNDIPILLSVRHIRHLVMEDYLECYDATSILAFCAHLHLSNLLHVSHTVERRFQRHGSVLPVLVAEYCIGGCQCVGKVGVVHVSPKSHERWPSDRSFRQSRAADCVLHVFPQPGQRVCHSAS